MLAFDLKMKFIVKIQNKSLQCITLQIQIVVMVVPFNQALKTEIKFYKCVNNCLVIKNHNGSLTENVLYEKLMAKKKPICGSLLLGAIKYIYHLAD